MNHSRIINNNNNAKPSGFIFYARAIAYLIFLFLQDFTFKKSKPSFESSLRNCKFNWDYLKTGRCDSKSFFPHIFAESSLIFTLMFDWVQNKPLIIMQLSLLELTMLWCLWCIVDSKEKYKTIIYHVNLLTMKNAYNININWRNEILTANVSTNVNRKRQIHEPCCI